MKQIETNEVSLENFANSYQQMGLHLLPNNDIKYREYAPGARGIALLESSITGIETNIGQKETNMDFGN